MSDELRPMTMEAFARRYERNQSITGYWPDTTIHAPCPFCAAAGWLTYRQLDVRTALVKGAMCRACGRAAKAIFVATPGDELRFELVQTEGPQQPEWLTPRMRRVDQ